MSRTKNREDREWLSSELAAPEDAPLRLPERDLRPQWFDLRLSLWSLMVVITGACLLAASIRILPRDLWIAIGEIAVFLGMVVLLASAILVASLTFVFCVLAIAWLLCRICALPWRMIK